jgi:hypothetical protein
VKLPTTRENSRLLELELPLMKDTSITRRKREKERRRVSDFIKNALSAFGLRWVKI